MTLNVRIGGKIKQARKACGLTQGELGAKIHRTAAAIAYLEKGQRGISPDVLSRISEATRKPISFFYEDGTDPCVELKNSVGSLKERLNEIDVLIQKMEPQMKLSLQKEEVELPESDPVAENINLLFNEHTEQKWRMFAEYTTDFVFIMDESGISKSINRFVAPYTAEQMIGVHCELWIHEDDKKEWSNKIKKVFKTGEVEPFELKANTPNGMSRYKGHFFPIMKDGRVYEVMAISRNLDKELKNIDEE